MQCSCSATLRWLCRRGARHACVQRKAERAEAHWSAADWLAHFDEEERLFCPLLPPDVAQRIRDDHKRFRAQIRVYGRVDMAQMKEHAQLEDRWADRLFARERKR